MRRLAARTEMPVVGSARAGGRHAFEPPPRLTAAPPSCRSASLWLHCPTDPRSTLQYAAAPTRPHDAALTDV